MRGYDADEVRTFLATVASQMDELIEERARTEDELSELKEKMGHLEDVQEALQATLNMARQNAEETRQAALKKAEMIIHEAHLKGEEILKKAERELDKLRADIGALETRRDQILAKVRSVLNAELEMLSSLSPEPVDEYKDTGVEVAALEYIDPKARAYKEELLAKAAAAGAREKAPGTDEMPSDRAVSAEANQDQQEEPSQGEAVAEHDGADREELEEAQGTDAGQDTADVQDKDDAEAQEKDAAGDTDKDEKESPDIAEVVASLKQEVGEEPDETGAADKDSDEHDEMQKIRRILDDLE